MPQFDSFVVFAAMRTGSNFLEANLNALPGVQCLGEVFNPTFIGKKDQLEMLGVTMAARAADPLDLLRRLRDRTDGLAGFRYFHDHDPRVLPEVLGDPACAKIILTRNPIESYVSWKIAQTTGQWKLTNPKNLRTAQVRFDGPEFERHMQALQAFQITVLHGLQTTGQTAFYIDYDDIGDIDVLNGLAAFLGVKERLDAPDATLKVQNPENIMDKVTNPGEMEGALARLDRFNLSRTPNFEPRRPPAIPSFIAANGAPLVYMPVRSGPEAQVAAWLNSLGRGGTRTDFVQKSLRQWKKANPLHRSFTVIRHPMLRAHEAFMALIVSGKLADHRALLIKAHKADLPPPGHPFPDTPAHQAAFVTFLHYAKLSVSGQTGQKVDPNWASQTAVIQGFASYQGPDIVIREDRMALGLAWLAAEVGIAAAIYQADQTAANALNAVYDSSFESACEDAYTRDYIAQGWTRWQQ